MIDLLVRAACDGSDSCDSGGEAPLRRPMIVSGGMDMSRAIGGGKCKMAKHTPPNSPPRPRGTKPTGLTKTPVRQTSEYDTLASLASSRHRSSFAHRFFQDLVTSQVGAYCDKSCPHHVAVLCDDRGSGTPRTSGGSSSAASWRPKHQLKSTRRTSMILRILLARTYTDG
jgi:hypothetical protein